ncbi:MAG: cupin domain-containing protein [Bacteroidales bacterium]|nr:cupin domain-containing protein [Bacteroidales bacterium]
MIKITTEQTATQVPFNIDGKIFHSSNKIETILIKLKAGEEMDIHKNPFDVFFFIISGKGELTTPDDYFQIEKNQSIYITKEELRGWKNTNDSTLEVLVVKII